MFRKSEEDYFVLKKGSLASLWKGICHYNSGMKFHEVLFRYANIKNKCTSIINKNKNN